jgi:DNA-binding LytR/AlgR family response regulator
LKSDSEKESVQLFLNDLFFIESADNYCRVYYRREKKIISVMLRSTLKRFEDQLKYPEVFRCHRTYVVNLRNVHKVSGNSQGYRLHFKDFDQTVPVSRKIGDDIHERLQKSIVQV